MTSSKPASLLSLAQPSCGSVYGSAGTSNRRAVTPTLETGSQLGQATHSEVCPTAGDVDELNNA
jgi:hypothetical protein